VQGEQVRKKICRLIHPSLAFLTTLLRYVVRDFQYSSDQIEKEREELQTADTAEKELWVSPPPNEHSLAISHPLIN
jgi:hypothetical protein